MTFDKLLNADPMGLLALAKEIRGKKIMGPWGPVDDPGAAYGWQAYSVRRSISGAASALHSPGAGQWHTSYTTDDDQPDTYGNREACDNYLRARGWILIDEPEPAAE